MTTSEITTADEVTVPYVDEFATHVSMHHTDAAGVVWVGAPVQWGQVGMENLFRAAGHPIESLKLSNTHYPIVRAEVNHHRKLRLGAELVVRTFVSRVGGRSFTVATQIATPTGEVHVTVELTGVANGRDGSKPQAEQWLRDMQSEAERNGLALGNRKGEKA